MVSAWASENRVVSGQVKTDEHSDEITAIPELLKVSDLKESIVISILKNIPASDVNKG